MNLPDVNIYLAALRPDHPEHALCHGWLTREYASGRAVGLLPQALSSVVRIATMPGFLKQPSTLEDALSFCQALMDHPETVVVGLGHNQWSEFSKACRATGAKGKLIPDAWFAATAIDHNCTWVSNDSDFAKFPGLKWQKPQ
jgi:uncharacterized protein